MESEEQGKNNVWWYWLLPLPGNRQWLRKVAAKWAGARFFPRAQNQATCSRLYGLQAYVQWPAPWYELLWEQGSCFNVTSCPVQHLQMIWSPTILPSLTLRLPSPITRYNTKLMSSDTMSWVVYHLSWILRYSPLGESISMSDPEVFCEPGLWYQRQSFGCGNSQWIGSENRHIQLARMQANFLCNENVVVECCKPKTFTGNLL